MKPTDTTNIFLTKTGLFISIITNIMGLAAACYVIFSSSQTGNVHFMEAFGAIMALGLFNAIRNTRRLLYTDRSMMTAASKSNPFLSVNGIIITTICSTAGLCLFIPILANNITKGDATMIALSLFAVAIHAYVLYRAMGDVHKYLRKKAPELYQQSY